MSAEDIDPDSVMGSSPSDSTTEEDTDLFPSETNAIGKTTTPDRPLTPQNNHLNALAPGELSPPRSESRSQTQVLNQQAANAEHGHSIANSNENGDANSSQVWATESMARDNRDDAAADGKPGSGWKSKRAQEDYHRAMESMVDRDFSLREFGDVLAPDQKPTK